MAEVTTYRCDVCGKLKQEANHWYLAHANAARFVIHRWDLELNYDPKLHLCGMECAQKAMAKAMQEGQ
jgi:hypothetical protein